MRLILTKREGSLPTRVILRKRERSDARLKDRFPSRQFTSPAMDSDPSVAIRCALASSG
jgi:hypothetical protein